MNKKVISLACMALLFVVMSCSKDSEGNIVTKMSAKIDGTAWNTVTRYTVMSSNTFTITGTTVTEGLIITTYGITEKTYTLDPNPLSIKTECGCTYKPSILSEDESGWYISTNGTVTLTKVDKTNKTISGTFNFTVAKSLTDTKEITSGQFNDISYTEQ